ncbi:hypothetical protein JCM5350_007418 [Sporobolomyces pararoseus]
MMRKARPFHPPANRESFKDLLIFEERLKQNAERLQKQRRKYQGFLLSLIAVILYLAYIVFLQPSIYSLVHYSNVACLLVAATTLVLFFATGMYSDKIAYAYKFVPQANRALRPFNIYLNTRHKSRFSFLLNFLNSSSSSSTTTTSRSRNPSIVSPSISRTPSGRSVSSSNSIEQQQQQGLESPSQRRLSLSRQTSQSSIESHTSFRSTGALRSVSPSPTSSPSSSPPSSPRIPSSTTSLPLPPPTPQDQGPVTRAAPPSTPGSTLRPITTGGGVPIPPIPPAQNPRGELIFSNRVNPSFREGYERYRGEWERRRKENKEIEYQQRKRINNSWWKIWNWGTTRRDNNETSKGVSSSGNGVEMDKKLSQEEDQKDRGRNLARGGGGDSSISADSSRINSRTNSTERSKEEQAESSSSSSVKTAAQTLLSTVSTNPQSSHDSLSPTRTRSSTTPTESQSNTILAPLDRDDPSSTSTPPPQSDSAPSSSPSRRTTTTTETSLKPSHQVHSRIRAESFSELLELEAANEEENGEPIGGGPGPPGMPELSRTSSYR